MATGGWGVGGGFLVVSYVVQCYITVSKIYSVRR